MLVCTQWLSICLLYALSYKVKIETKNTSLGDVFFVFIICVFSHNSLRPFKDNDYTNIYFKSMSYKEQMESYLGSSGEVAYKGNLIWNLFHIES